MLKEGQPGVAEQRKQELQVLTTYAPYASGILIAAAVFLLSRNRLGNTGAATAGALSGLLGGWVFSQFL